MPHAPHELAEEFPDKTDRIHELKISDAHFQKLMDDYHNINAAIFRAESKIEPIDPMHETTMRKERMLLKDEIARIIG